ncbi:MAG TPA: beta-ketoacyl synthase N-terminal-like domain-containing protein [Edaphocola sp.]|nr:beta-ketoacyl synthase N-terminal-like domain-containing protein [Edaphocola sp.]
MPVYIQSSAVFCPLGYHTGSVFEQMLAGRHAFSPRHFGPEQKREMVAAIPGDLWHELYEEFPQQQYSDFEKLCLFVAQQAIAESQIDTASEDCLFILSTTKGNIAELDLQADERISLFTSAQKIAGHFNNPNRPLVVSNACISGVLALILAKDALENNRYRHVIVTGADMLSDFVVRGFQSFFALSDEPCRPFDAGRRGLNLGEAAACVILTNNASETGNRIKITGGGLSNDANHLSGPSRSGEELAAAIKMALAEAHLPGHGINFISAHGTATRYNDEMEAKALALAGVNHAPLHSLKSYLGHTLGTAGIIETIFGAVCLEKGLLLPSLNFRSTDAPVPIHVIQTSQNADLKYLLKTASGFGGCNAALVLEK